MFNPSNIIDMKKCIFILLLLLSWISVIPLMAENNVPSTDFVHGRHALRLGWGLGSNHPYKNYINITSGDPIDPIEAIQGMTSAEAHDFLQSYRKTANAQYSNWGHLFLAYQYNFNHWLSAGLELDWLHCQYLFDYQDGYGVLVERARTSYLDQMTIMPTVRFTYFRRPLVELYSGLGLGYTLSVESFVSHGFTFSPTLFGLNVGNEHWFAEVELGAMATVSTSWLGTTDLLFSSRILSAAIGYRF